MAALRGHRGGGGEQRPRHQGCGERHQGLCMSGLQGLGGQKDSDRPVLASAVGYTTKLRASVTGVVGCVCVVCEACEKRSGVCVCAIRVCSWGVLRYQITRTQAEPQRIVAQRPLSRVQSLVLYLSRIQRICLSLSLNLFPPRLPRLSRRGESRCNGMILDWTSQSIRTHENL